MNKIILLLFVILVNCQSKSNRPEKQLPKISEIKQETIIQPVVNDTINGAVGILVQSESYDFGDTINIYTRENEILDIIFNKIIYS